MSRLYLCIRVLAVVVAFPAIALYIVGAMLLHAIGSLGRSPRANAFHVALRLWMNVLDWTKGIPVGYSYWEQYQAPVMLDEIAVHHDD